MVRALLFFLVSLVACSAEPRLDPPSLTIAVTSDLHELAPALHDNGAAYRRYADSGAGRDILHTEALLDAFERDLQAAAPAWLLVTGDLTNNGERESHRALASRLARIEARGTRVLVIPGNHDVSNPWSRSFVGEQQLLTPAVGPREFADIYQEFGYREARARDPSSLSYCVEATPRLWFLMLDTNRYGESPDTRAPVTSGRLKPSTLDWIRAQGEAASRAHARIIVAQHHSLFDHSPVIAQGFTLDNASETQHLFVRLGIHLVFSGHIHIQDIVRSEDGLTDIASNSLAVFPNQWGILRLDLRGGTAQYRTQEVDVEGWARAVGCTEPELLAYETWSTARFAESSFRLARRGLGGADGESAQTLALLNQRYFAGRENLNSDLRGSSGLQILLESDGFLSSYAASILDDDSDDNRADLGF